jgi:hypothetical protein
MNEKKHTTSWPKTYLLAVYSRALAEGCVRLPLPDEATFRSFSQAFYRLRRRSDSQHASFILPEYHLIFCTWEPDRGTCLVTYDALPDGMQLPPIQSVDATDRTPAPQKRVVSLPQEEEDFDPEKFVAGLVAEAGDKIGVDDSDGL